MKQDTNNILKFQARNCKLITKMSKFSNNFDGFMGVITIKISLFVWYWLASILIRFYKKVNRS